MSTETKFFLVGVVLLVLAAIAGPSLFSLYCGGPVSYRFTSAGYAWVCEER